MLHFFLGTEAELIKTFPVMLELKKRNVNYDFIATGQHNISESEVLRIFKLSKPKKVLYKGPKFTSIAKMLVWATKMLILSNSEIRMIFDNDKEGIVVLHGDTVSAALGAMLAKRAGLKIAHIEAGMWSRNYLNPFPEEIDRRIISHFSDINFCPADSGYDNLKKYSNKTVINTKQNTQIDAFFLIKKYFKKKTLSIVPKKYFIFILHRTENLSNKSLVTNLISLIQEQSKKVPCIFIMHHTSEDKLQKYGLLTKIRKNKQVICLPRLTYSEFVKLLSEADFLVTDGGGNQMEGAYIGIPTLLLRRLTESPEGIGKNVILSKLDMQIIGDFFHNYSSYRQSEMRPKVSPSKMIADELIGQIKHE